MSNASDHTRARLVRPLAAGEPLSHWLLGPVVERRYDVPDQPMAGEMDPFFFLTKHKNFIPHEYPCRTQFAAERRGRKPEPVHAFEPARVWLPFGSPRVDLSGFWFRPTWISATARTVLRARSAGTARLRLATCGGAVLAVGGREAGFMAPYGRNLESEETFEVELHAGENEITVFFDDLAERDARFYFQLDYLSGPDAELALPISGDPALADAVEQALSAMHFEKPAYSGGEVALVLPHPVPVEAAADIAIEGDFMSTERISMHRALAPGADRLVVADATELPADFRHFKVTLSVPGFSAARVFGVEISHADRQGPAPAGLDARIREALVEVGLNGEADTVTALARLAVDLPGPDTEAAIEAALPSIEDCHDCADFLLVPLLFVRARYADRLSSGLNARIDAAILGYRYWMDEPGNDVQWYFSENHALLFHTAAYLAGHQMPDATFRRSGRRGSEQSAVGAGRVRAWLDHFEAWEMAEFNSAPYFPIDLKGLATLYALAPDADIRERSGKAIVRLIEVVANSAHQGVLTGAQGRSYEHTLRAGRSLELSGIARMLWGRGSYGRRFHALPQLAIAMRDDGLEVPAELAERALYAGDGALEWCFAQGQDRFARLYHYKTRDVAMGTAARYRWFEWGYQETVLQLRIGDDPDAQVWINHPGEVIHSGYGRPSYWGGSGSLPRVQQYRGLAVVLFETKPGQPAFTHAWFPQAAFDEVTLGGDTALARSAGGLLMLKGAGPLEPVVEGPTAGNELRQQGTVTRWIVRLGSARRHGSLAGFRNKFASLDVGGGTGSSLVIEDPDYGRVEFHEDGRVTAEGRTLEPADWTVTGVRASLPAD